MNTKVEIFDRTKKKKLINKLEKEYGIKELPYLILKTGSEKFRIYSGIFSTEELNYLAKKINVQLIGTPLCTIKNEDIRLNFDTLNIPLIKSQISKNEIELSDEEIKKWIRGENIEKDIENKSKFIIVKNNKDYIGSGYNGKTFLKNYVPKERRVKGKN